MATATRVTAAQLAKLASQGFRHVLAAGRGAGEVARTVLGLEIAPALERPPRPRLDQGELRLQHQVAATDSLLVDEGADIDEPLPAHDLTADHPIKRAAVEQLVGTLGNHARPVQVLARQAALLAVLEPRADPGLELPDGVTADAKLDEMKCHEDDTDPQKVRSIAGWEQSASVPREPARCLGWPAARAAGEPAGRPAAACVAVSALRAQPRRSCHAAVARGAPRS